MLAIYDRANGSGKVVINLSQVIKAVPRSDDSNNTRLHMVGGEEITVRATITQIAERGKR